MHIDLFSGPSTIQVEEEGHPCQEHIDALLSYKALEQECKSSQVDENPVNVANYIWLASIEGVVEEGCAADKRAKNVEYVIPVSACFIPEEHASNAQRDALPLAKRFHFKNLKAV